ncbi:MAG TPA: tryptophan--tRNA ligase [Candidatus Vogelbacteria bacterium]|nr:tryptophan--tRNA ligase [Candidatus Vogelbacteria bacterium]
MNKKYLTEIFTGIRPTGGLTVANYLGAVRPIVELQKKFTPLVFVADIHGLTDKEPKEVGQYVEGVVADYLALGLNPSKTNIYLQSAVAGEVSFLTLILSRLTTVSELLRVPTLKDKLKNKDNPEVANALLFFYPVLMAADILLNKAERVPVGEDQLAHLEITRRLAEKFNKKYGDIFPLPQTQEMKALRVLSLKGEGKMSKSIPAGAIFLTDDLKTIEKKIKSAETAFEGEMTPKLKSHILITKELATEKEDLKKVDDLIKEHEAGKAVLGEFKKVMSKVVIEFIDNFQKKRLEIVKDKDYVRSILEKGNKIAKENATKTINDVLKTMDFYR